MKEVGEKKGFFCQRLTVAEGKRWLGTACSTDNCKIRRRKKVMLRSRKKTSVKAQEFRCRSGAVQGGAGKRRGTWGGEERGHGGTGGETGHRLTG